MFYATQHTNPASCYHTSQDKSLIKDESCDHDMTQNVLANDEHSDLGLRHLS